MPAVNISKNQPCKAKGLGGVFLLRSKNVAPQYTFSSAEVKGGKRSFLWRESVISKKGVKITNRWQL